MATPPTAPLAERVRPRTLDQYVGQQHLLGPDAPLGRILGGGQLPSIIFWGPPGTGKTTLARLVAAELDRYFLTLSAVTSGVKEVRAKIEEARMSPGAILFIDEIHRFNKSQQDALLHAVESGTVTLIGATTENPSFEVIRPLLSRCQVYVLEDLGLDDISTILNNAIRQDADLAARDIRLDELGAIYRLSGGDARKALNILELLAGQRAEGPVHVTDAAVMDVTKRHIARYDKGGEQHYDQISAFIKSVRGGSPDGALYWLARMLEGGEDLRFIARRLIILAAEDIGNANPNALLLANATFQAVDVIGMPEARIILGQCTTYLATSPKSNASYEAINAAMSAAARQGDLPVPMHLRNAPTQLMKDLGYSAGYKYSHAYSEAEGRQSYLPEGLEGTQFYRPKDAGSEARIADFMRRKWGYEGRGEG